MGMFLTIMGLVIGAITYVSLCVKVGFIVADATEDSGFQFGFYMITVLSLIALPIAAMHAWGGVNQ
jgi:hypothetical protein